MTEFSIEDLLRLSDDGPLAEDAPAGQREHLSLLPVDYDPFADPIPRPNAYLYAGLIITLTDRRIDALRNPPALNGRRMFCQGNRVRARRWTKRGPGGFPVPVPEQCA